MDVFHSFTGCESITFNFVTAALLCEETDYWKFIHNFVLRDFRLAINNILCFEFSLIFRVDYFSCRSLPHYFIFALEQQIIKWNFINHRVFQVNQQSRCEKVLIKHTVDCLLSITPVTTCAAPLMEKHCMCSSFHRGASVCKQLSNDWIKNTASSSQASLRFTTLQLYKFTT